jgi:hypothetical protein
VDLYYFIIRLNLESLSSLYGLDICPTCQETTTMHNLSRHLSSTRGDQLVVKEFKDLLEFNYWRKVIMSPIKLTERMKKYNNLHFGETINNIIGCIR